MIVRFARHGQPALDELPSWADPEFPPEDYVLTELGRTQAHCLGRYLNGQGFRGRIISSPFLRTVETADAVAEECGLRFYLEPRIQEVRKYTTPYQGLTLAQIRAHSAHLAEDAVLSWPWTVKNDSEGFPQVCERVDAFVEELLAHPPAEDILLVGHGASIGALKRNFFARSNYKGDEGDNWNCSVSRFDVAPDGTATLVELARHDFMPAEMVTSNRIFKKSEFCP